MTSVEEHVRAEEEFGLALADYAGLWVMVEDRKVLDSDADLQSLVDRLGAHRDTAVVFKVMPAAPCFF